MQTIDFLNIYIPALELALANDFINYGYHVKGPEDYIDEKYLFQAENFIKNDSTYKTFFDSVGYYFDAKSHNFPKVGVVDIAIVREELVKQIHDLKTKFGVFLRAF